MTNKEKLIKYYFFQKRHLKAFMLFMMEISNNTYLKSLKKILSLLLRHHLLKYISKKQMKYFNSYKSIISLLDDLKRNEDHHRCYFLLKLLPRKASSWCSNVFTNFIILSLSLIVELINHNIMLYLSLAGYSKFGGIQFSIPSYTISKYHIL